MMQGDTSAIANTIRQLLPNPPPVVRVLAYRDEASLEALWGLSSHGRSGAVGDGTLVLIDDDRVSPLMPDRMGAHLSALDWALLHCAADDFGASGPIIVLDLRMRLRPRVFDTDRSYLPAHVHYFAPSRFGLDQLDRFVACLGNLVSAERRDDEAATFFRTRWLASLAMADTRAGHHEMNNSLAPLLLALGDTPLEAQLDLPADTNDTQSRRPDVNFTRRVMLRALAYAAPADPAPVGLQPVRWCPPKGCGEVRFLLVDDQADEGWIPVLARALGFDLHPGGRVAGPFKERARGPRSSLWCATDGMAVLQQVWPDGIPESPSGGGPWRAGKFLRLTAEAGDSAYTEVLFLDLRLFARNPSMEPIFFEKLAAACEDATRTAPAWRSQLHSPGFARSTAYLEALASFAKLICEVDFTYPLVIWSSTAQRKVTEALKGHENMITGLEKPRFDAYAPSPQELQAVFEASAAAALARVNELILAKLLSSQLFVERDVLKLPENMNHVEIYFDESGTSDQDEFVLGAFIVFYESAQVASALQSDLAKPCFTSVEFSRTRENKDSLSGNLNFQKSEDTGVVFTGDARLPKKFKFGVAGGVTYDMDWFSGPGEVRPIVAKRLSTAMAGRAKAIWIEFTSTTPIGDYGVDGRYPTALAESLKLIFTLFVRGSHRTASVYVATKQARAQNEQEASTIFGRYGLVSAEVKGSWKYDAMANHSAYQPAMDAHRFAEGRGGSCKLAMARGVTLSYKHLPPRPAHYEWQLTLDILKALQLDGTLNADDVLNQVRPGATACLDNTWRHMHYFADELLEHLAVPIYSRAGVLMPYGALQYDMFPADASAPRTLADVARALLWENYEEAAKLFLVEVLKPRWRKGSQLSDLEQFVASRFSAAASEHDSAKRMWSSIRNCLTGEVAQERSDVMIFPFDATRDAAIQQNILESISSQGWKGRPLIEANTFTLPDAKGYLDLIAGLLPDSMRAH